MTGERAGAQAWILVAGLALGIALVVALAVASGGQGNDTATVLTDETVVAQLAPPGTAWPEPLRAALQAARANPRDIAAAKAAARALIAEGRARGDSRLVGSATGILRTALLRPDAEALYLAATARQYQHDFPGALAMLDQAEALDPRDVDVLLSRATILTVLGQFDAATETCARIQAARRPDIAFLCQSTALLLTDRAPEVALRLGQVVQAPGMLDPALHGWATGLLAEIAALQGDTATARRHFQTVLDGNPLALRERLLLADLLLADGEAETAMTLLDPAPATDGVLIRRVLAARAVGDDARAAEDAATLAQRVQLNLDLGLTAHAREEALYFLRIAPDPARAVARARINWAMQHEIEDARLLLEAAVAAGDPAAATPVLAWIAEQAVVVPTLVIPDAVREAAR